MRTAVGTALAGVALVIAAGTAEAQALQAGRFTVTPILGTIRWDEASALANKEADERGAFTQTVFTPTIGLQADYKVWQQLGVGFYFEAARPTTRGDYFPAALFNFQTGSVLRTVSQRVTTFIYGVQATLGFDIGQLQPYLSGGAGAVSVDLDAEQASGNRSFTNGSFQLGGGIGWQVSPSTSVRLDLRDYVFTGWDREQLNVVSPAYQNNLFPAANGNPPAPKSTVHNVRLAIGVSFVPRFGGGVSDTENNQQE